MNETANSWCCRAYGPPRLTARVIWSGTPAAVHRWCRLERDEAEGEMMTDGASAALVRHAVEGGIATVTLDSPHNRNALSARLRSKLLEQLMAALSNESVRVVVLTHVGPVFCAGADLKEASSAVPPVGAEFTSILEAIWLSPKPVVARVAGPARAGGLGLVAACDIALPSQAATFALTEVRIGVVAAVISVTLLPRLLPRAAQELFLTGETFDAKRAVAVGLLNRAVPAYDLTRKSAGTLTCWRLAHRTPWPRQRSCCVSRRPARSVTIWPPCAHCLSGTSRRRRAGRESSPSSRSGRPPGSRGQNYDPPRACLPGVAGA